MRDIHGTNAIGGLDVGKAAHLIDDSSLLESANGWTDKAGEWSVAPGNTRLYSGYTDIEDCCAGTIDGSEVVTYIDGNSFYADGVLVGTVPGTGDKQIVAVADGFLIVGGTVNYIYDANGFREQGCWQADRIIYDGASTPIREFVATAWQPSAIATVALINNVTDENNPVISTDVEHGLSAGDYVYIKDVRFRDIGGRGGVVVGRNTESSLNNATHIVIETPTTQTFQISWTRDTGRIYDQSATGEDLGVVTLPAGGLSISDVTLFSNYARVTTTTSHALDSGAIVRIRNVGGIDGINDKTFVVIDAVSSTMFNIRTTGGVTGSYTSSGFVNKSESSLIGIYKYYIVPAIELSDGKILEGKPRGIPIGNTLKAEPDDGSSWDAGEVVAGSEQTGIYLSANVAWLDEDGDPLFNISGTMNVDYEPFLRLYRTKSNGTDFYLEAEFRDNGDASKLLSYSDGVFSIGGTYGGAGWRHYSGLSDINLGAVYLYSNTAHENPLPAITAARLGSDIFFVPQDYPNEVHWTNAGEWEFSDPTNSVWMLDNISALKMFRNEMISFSERRIWPITLIDGFPAIREIETTVGTAYPKAMEEVPGALLFLREDGIWAFDGIKTFNTSHNTFYGNDVPVSIAASGDLVVAQWESRGLVGRETAMGTVWHDTDTVGAIVTDSGGSLYCADNNMIYSMFDGNKTYAVMTSKAFDTKIGTPSGKPGDKRVYRVTLDVTGADIQECWINGSRQDDTLLHDARGKSDDRRLVSISIPRLSNPYITIRLQIGGNAVVHGYYFETER